MFKQFAPAAIAAAAAAVFAAAPAAAVTVVIDQTVTNNDATVWDTIQSFNVGAGVSNAFLNLTSAVADDQAVIRVNGFDIVGFGIGGPAAGNFYLTSVDPAVPFNYAYGNGAVGASFAVPLNAGLNFVQIIVNNTGVGISPSAQLSGGPSNLAVVGTITFDAAGVPEPASWALLIAGFGLTGAALRRRRTAVAA